MTKFTVSHVRGQNTDVPQMSTSVDGKTKFTEAVSDGDVEAARTLLKKKLIHADVSMRNGRTAMHMAAKAGHRDLCKVLIEYDAEVNELDLDGLSPLHLAAKLNHVKVCELLLKHGANVDAFDEKGSTPLHLAAMNSHEDVCALLIETGANKQAESDFGTPWECAVGAACKEMLTVTAVQDF